MVQPSCAAGFALNRQGKPQVVWSAGRCIKPRGAVSLARKTALLCALAPSLLLAACSSPRAIVSGSAVNVVSPEQAFISLGPGTPAILSVVQTSYTNATRQNIALATTGRTPGQNELRVDIYGTSSDAVGREMSLSDRPLTQESVTSEAQAALQGVPLRLSLNYVQNQYGPFGYAIGRAPQGDYCIYAWQRLATSDVNVSLLNRRATISLRLRLCEPGASETALVAAMMGLHVNASLSSGSWDAEPKPLSPDLGAAGVPMGPLPSAAALPDAPAAAPARSRRKAVRVVPRARATPVPAVAASPASSGVVVPAPPAAGASPGNAPVVPPPPVIPAPGAQP